MRHTADDGILVGLAREQGKQLIDLHAGYVGGDGLGERTAVVVAGGWFGIEGVHVRGAAPHPDLDDGFGFSRLRGGPGWAGGGAGQEQTACSEEAAAEGVASGYR